MLVQQAPISEQQESSLVDRGALLGDLRSLLSKNSCESFVNYLEAEHQDDLLKEFQSQNPNILDGQLGKELRSQLEKIVRVVTKTIGKLNKKPKPTLSVEEYSKLAENPTQILDTQTAIKLRNYLNIEKLNIGANRLRTYRWVNGQNKFCYLSGQLTFGTVMTAFTEIPKLLALPQKEYLKECEKRERRRSKKITMAAVIEQYINNGELNDFKPNTKDSYEDILKRINEAFGEMQIHQLETAHVRKWLFETRKHISPKKRREQFNWLIDLLDYAIEELGWIDSHKVKPRRIKKKLNRQVKVYKMKKTEILDAEDIRLMIHADQQLVDKDVLGVVRDMAVVSSTCFLNRPAEAMGLALEDFEFKKRVLLDGTEIEVPVTATIKRTLNEHGYGTPKIFKQEEDVLDVYDNVLEPLMRLIEHAKQYPAIEVEVLQDDGSFITETIHPIFVNPETDKVYSQKQYRSRLKKLCIVSKTKKVVTPRCLRKSGAKILNQTDMPNHAKRKQLTHTDSEVGRRHYDVEDPKVTQHDIKSTSKQLEQILDIDNKKYARLEYTNFKPMYFSSWLLQQELAGQHTVTHLDHLTENEVSHYLSGDTLLELQVRNRDPFWSKKPVEKVDSLPIWAFDKLGASFLEKYNIKLLELYEPTAQRNRVIRGIGW